MIEPKHFIVKLRMAYFFIPIPCNLPSCFTTVLLSAQVYFLKISGLKGFFQARS